MSCEYRMFLWQLFFLPASGHGNSILLVGPFFLQRVSQVAQWLRIYQWRRCRSDPWVGKIPWRRKWQLTSVFLPGKSHGQRSLVSYSPWRSQRVGHNWVTEKACIAPFPLSWPISQPHQTQLFRTHLNWSWPGQDPSLDC